MSWKRVAASAVLGLCLTLSSTVRGDEAAAPSLAPFGAGMSMPKRQVKVDTGKLLEIDCLSPARAAMWVAENPKAGQKTNPFTIEQTDGEGVLTVSAGAMEPGRTTVRILLPGDGPANGAVWSKSQATYVSFNCKSNKPADMTFHLLQRGKTAGTFQTGFSVKGADWQHVILPIAEFKLKTFSSIAGLGVRVASADNDAEVSFKDFSVGGVAFTDDSWKSHRVSISLNGDWHFAADPGDQGTKENWSADSFDDSKWQRIKSGMPWQQQGINHAGWGWYRQQLFVPKECAGLAITLNLVPIPADDDTYFNGVRVGGFSGEYKYNNWMTRAYTVPASLIRYGENNTIAIRIWGGNLTFIGEKSGLIKGPLTADIDPYRMQLRDVGGQAMPAELYDLSDARQGKPFEIVFPFPSDVAKEPGAQLGYRIADYLGNEIKSGKVPLTAGADGVVQGVVSIDRETANAIYLRGRFRASLVVENGAGAMIYSGTRDGDHLSFFKRDDTPLPPLPEQFDDTSYGKLKLVDEIDSSVAPIDDVHPYTQSGFNHEQDRMPPGSPVNVKVTEILGKKARESDYGWFAYRLGRGKLKPHTTYLVRFEYPEDKPRFVPIEIQTGQNYMDVGYKNGVGADDVYDNWPLSHAWQWYDVIIPLDDNTVGTGGAQTAPAENGLWVYFMNKLRPNAYYAMWSGGPAIGRIRLYEIDATKNAPAIQKPKDLPQRVLGFDWERGADHDPADFVQYAKLMGYNSISPIMLKWYFANFTDPLNGYTSIGIDDQNYWTAKEYDPTSGEKATSPTPKNKSEHVRYLEATKQYGLNYVPRIEWGGSQDLPKEAYAIDVNGQPTKPNRFAPWCADLLHPATWEDLQKFMDHAIKPYAQDNPQLMGALWRIRCDRMPISYSAFDIKMFSDETNTPLPPGGDAQRAAWAAGEMKVKYDDWWHQKREAFHAKLVNLLKSYRPDMTLYYYNWDEDKFGLINTDITAWAFVSTVVKPGPTGGRAAYERERALRKTYTAADYIHVMHTGNFGDASRGINRADYGIRPELYKDLKGMEIFAPANYLCYADKPDYLNYFQTADGLAVSNVVSYDEVGSRSINPKYEGNMLTPGGAAFSMALELLPYFHGDARTLNYTVYTYGRGFADAHRRFAQAFLALPAIPATVVDQPDKDLKIRTYASPNGTYVGVAYKGYAASKLTIKVPGVKAGATLKNLVTNETVPATIVNDELQFELQSGPMELNAYLIQ